MAALLRRVLRRLGTAQTSRRPKRRRCHLRDIAVEGSPIAGVTPRLMITGWSRFFVVLGACGRFAIGARVVQRPAKGTDNQRWHFQAYNDR